jgi:hypothetical protein
LLGSYSEKIESMAAGGAAFDLAVAAAMIPLTVANVVFDDGCERFGFRRETLLSPLFYLESNLRPA